MTKSEREEIAEFCQEVKDFFRRVESCKINETGRLVSSLIGFGRQLQDKADMLQSKARRGSR